MISNAVRVKACLGFRGLGLRVYGGYEQSCMTLSTLNPKSFNPKPYIPKTLYLKPQALGIMVLYFTKVMQYC